MGRRAKLTVLELGASPSAWASSGLGTDDWIVVAQQSDEPAREFGQRVNHRALRLRQEDTDLESVEVYAAPRRGAPSSLVRRHFIEELGTHLAEGGTLTLWSASDDEAGDAELAAILAQFAPVLAKRQIAVNHQTCTAPTKSGVRHAIPEGPTPSGHEFDFDAFFPE